MNKSFFIFCLWVFVISIWLSSCKDDLAFEAENKATIDTMYHRLLGEMTNQMDSLCLEKNKTVYLTMFDSILDVRIAQIEHRLAQSKNDNQ